MGAWETVVPSPLTPPPALIFRRAVTMSGCVVFATNNTATGSLAAASFDIIQNAWATLPDVSATTANFLGDPFALEFGGLVVMIDELAPSSAVTLDFGNQALGWGSLGIPGGPSGQRIGQRFVAWGPTVYAYGGVELLTNVTHNDIWAVDFTGLITQQSSPPQWVQVTADGVQGVPPGRVGYTLTPFGVGMTLYGGVSVDGAPPPFGVFRCFEPAFAAQCHFHTHVWAFVPGNRGQPVQNSLTGTSWIMLNEGAAYANGPVPAGRVNHVAGAMGDQLYSFGGITSTGPSSELWAYNLVSQTFQQVVTTSPWPSAVGTDLGFSAGLVVGRHLYIAVQRTDPVTRRVMPGTVTLWRWAPSASGGAGPGPQAAPAKSDPAIVAGLVIAILVGLANLGLVVFQYFRGAAARPQATAAAMGGAYEGLPS